MFAVRKQAPKEPDLRSFGFNFVRLKSSISEVLGSTLFSGFPKTVFAVRKQAPREPDLRSFGFNFVRLKS